MGKFKRRKKFNNLIIYLGIFLISIAFTIKYLYKEDLINNNTIVDELINDNLGNFKNDITDVDFLLKYALNVDLIHEEKVFENDEQNEALEIENKDDKIEETHLPIVYLYNSHQDEKYGSNSLEPYNIASTVFLASKILKEYLEDEGIYTLVETDSVTDKIHSLNLNYSSSYKVSRMFMESAKQNNPSLKYFIDIHRDSSKYENTTTKIAEEGYAKVLFVVGLDNPNYEPNLQLAENMKTKIEAWNPNLFRGIMKKSGKGVNGVYNQDFSPNTMLIEVGGQYNSISEVNNTLKVLAKILANYIKENQNE